MVVVAVLIQTTIHPACFFPAMKNTKATAKMEKKAAKKGRQNDSDPDSLELQGN
jgi:hypothetical protein